jgi:hypothetical protein
MSLPNMLHVQQTSRSVKEVQQKVGGAKAEVGRRIFEPTGSVFSKLREVAAQLGALIEIAQCPLNIHEQESRQDLMKLLELDTPPTNQHLQGCCRYRIISKQRAPRVPSRASGIERALR